MPRNTQLVELQLRGGVLTNESQEAIGPRLFSANNAVWNYRYPKSINVSGVGNVSVFWGLRQPLQFAHATGTSCTGAERMFDLVVYSGGVYVFGVQTTSSYYTVWTQAGGSPLTFDGSATRAALSSTYTTTKRHGCSVVWDNPGTHPNTGAALSNPVVVFSHVYLNQVYYKVTTSGNVFSLTVDTTNCPAGAAALAVHLDRLWLARGKLVYFTDPLNLDSIRSTNVINVGDEVTCLIGGQYGAIDASGVPHLVIGGDSSVAVLDGDPQLGGAALRVLSQSTGILGPHAAVTTPYGVYFLGTDGNLWNIPPGTAEMFRVGDPIAGTLGINQRTLVIDIGEDATGHLAWFDPYLYIYPGGEVGYAFIAEPQRDGQLTFWGPVTVDSTNFTSGQFQAIVVSNSPGRYYAPSGLGVPSLHAVEQVPESANAPRILRFDAQGATSMTNRSAIIQSGLITVPGHAVQCMRVILETLKVPQVSAADVNWTVTPSDENTLGSSMIRLPESQPSAGSYSNRDIVTQHFVPRPGSLPASRGVRIQVTSTAGAHMGLLRALVEIRTTPAQF